MREGGGEEEVLQCGCAGGMYLSVKISVLVLSHLQAPVYLSSSLRSFVVSDVAGQFLLELFSFSVGPVLL